MPDRPVTLTSCEEARFLADLILKHSSGDHTFISLHDQHGGTTRFANNQVVQNVNARRLALTVTVAFEHRQGSASTSDLSVGAVREVLQRAEAIARVAPVDPEYVPPEPPHVYPAVPAWREETDLAGPSGRIRRAHAAIDLCQAAQLRAAGIVFSHSSVSALAADTGLFAYEPRTEARFSLTATGADATGWAATAHRSIDQLQVEARTRAAIDSVKLGAEAKEIPPGRYTVILEPAAVLGLVSWMIWTLDAKAYDKNTSPFSGKLGSRIVDPRLTLRNLPDHPDLLGMGFTGEGLPTTDLAWIEDGVLTQLAYDRFTARAHRIERIPTLDAPCLIGAGPKESAAEGVEALVRGTERGILVRNFWYIRSVNPTDLTLTGMTRDGTFLIEGGKMTRAVRNFRFHDSPLRAFNHLEAFTAPVEATTGEGGKMLVPALKISDFNFSSVTRF